MNNYITNGLIDERLFFARKIKMEIKEPNSDLSKSCKFVSLEFLTNKKIVELEIFGRKMEDGR